MNSDTGAAVGMEKMQLLAALRAVRKGDFSVRLPEDQNGNGSSGSVAEVFNEIVEMLSHKLALLVDAVDFIRGKIDAMSGHMGIVSRAVSSLFERFILGNISDSLDDHGEKKKRKKKKDVE